MKYIYWVSYAHRSENAWGMGANEVEVSGRIEKSDAVLVVTDAIKSRNPYLTDVVVLNWILLRKEK